MEVISQVFFGHVKMYVFDTVTTDIRLIYVNNH